MSYDLVIVGMGSAGMTAAEFAAGLGVRVAVVERARVGGDCLWTGCVPSKALLASARTAHVMRNADRFGLDPVDTPIDTERVWARLRRVQEEIAADEDDPGRFVDMGIDVIEGTASLAGPGEVVVDGDTTLDTRFVLLCTGSRPSVPRVDGLDEAGFLTSDNLFELHTPPTSVVMIGAGPRSIELAQAMSRLGMHATMVEEATVLLAEEEPTLADMLGKVLEREGVGVHLGARVQRVTVGPAGKTVHCAMPDGSVAEFAAAEILVANGRTANVDGLGLEALGVRAHTYGIEVDDRMRTSVPTIYAAGDVAGRHVFTHSAAYEAVCAVRDMFLPGTGKANALVPWCVFTDPELAHAGLTVAEAEARYGDGVQVWRQDLAHSDRARAEGWTDGCILIVTAPKQASLAKNRVVVGAHILAPRAGEVIHELVLAIREKVPFSSLGALVHIYPTLSTGIHQLAGEAAFERAESFRWLVKKAKK